jgi:NADH dehydrogenase FAD-containing subunit
MRPHVIIIGGGFGGLYAARALRNAPLTSPSSIEPTTMSSNRYSIKSQRRR